MGPDHHDASEVLAANRRFYHAIETGNFEAMVELWEQSKRAICVHPGWQIRRGWDAVASSWVDLLHAAGAQALLSNASVTIEGDLAWVVLDEDVVRGENTVTFAATNLFARHGDTWLMVMHHRSPVLPEDHWESADS